MALLQKTVLNSYLNSLDKDKLDSLYDDFVAYYHNDEVQSNIKNLTEIQFQSEFLSRLFVGALGYTLNPSPNYNLSTEYKNPKDAKKADGAVIIGDKVPVVIELKGMDTTDLNQVETQAFGYKNNQPSCHYIVTANFEKLRFYIDNAIEYIEFNLFRLTRADFYLLYLCLSFESIAADTPKKIKQESIAQESKVSHLLYKDYATFKSALYTDLTANNSTIDPLVLFEKSQKLLDRFLFIFFAEDKGLLPPNFIRYIINNWKILTDLDAEQSLYERFKINFNYLNKGHSNKDRTIFAYNGGLFAPDSILDELIIDDELLHQHTQKLSDYDFNSEIDVNILGHIFENSLSEIDEVKAKLSGNPIDKSQTKRKKDGVFYTPKYITKYIVENTLGKLCEDKKAELAITVTETDENGNTATIDNPEYRHKKGRKKATVKALYETLMTYQQWLLSLTICDPACGSGAFLNETLNFLIKEHRYINELELKLTGTSLPLSNIENHILENNIYGVDINAESVDIAKLALWLRTAKKNRKLNDLSNNLKCGNSLIDDPQVAGELAFDWEKAFPHVFANGGFDVVIGNPPYVQLQKIKAQSAILKTLNYQTYDSTGDLYCLFYERGNQLLKSGGLFGYITSNKWMRTGYGKPLRQFFTSQTIPLILVDLGANIFESATIDSNILIFQKRSTVDNINKVSTKALDLSKETNFKDFSIYEQQAIAVSYQGDEIWTIESPLARSINAKLTAGGMPLKDWDIEINYGIKTGYNDAFFIDTETKDRLIAEDAKSAEVIKPLLRGRDIKPYHCEFADLWLINLHNGYNNFERLKAENFPAIKAHLDKYYQRLEKRYDKGETPYNLRSCAYLGFFTKEKIIYPNMTKFLPFFYDSTGFFANQKVFIITGENLKYLLAYLNSNVSKYWIRKNCPELGSGESPRYELSKVFFEHIPIPTIDDNAQQPFIEKADQMLTLNADLQTLSAKFLRMLARQFDITAPNKKLQKWYELDDKTFFIELEKDRKKVFKAETGSTKGFKKTQL